MFSFSYLNTHELAHSQTRRDLNISIVRLHSHTYKETYPAEKRESKGGWLPSAANKQGRERERKMTRAKRKRGEEQPDGENHNHHNDNNNRGPNERGNKRERETDGHAHNHTTNTHTHTRASASSKWHSRRSEKRDRQTRRRTAHARGIWWLNNEQKIHANSPISARRSTENKQNKKKNWEGKRENKQTNKQMTSCFISSASMRDPERRRHVLANRTRSNRN